MRHFLNSSEVGKEELATIGSQPPRIGRLLLSYPLELISTGLFVAVCILWSLTGVPLHPFRALLPSHLAMTGAALLLCLSGFSIVRSLRVGHREGWANSNQVFRQVFSQHFSQKVLARSGWFLILAGFVLVAFSVVKQAIPLVNPRLYDEQLIVLEGWLHGGLHPAWFLAEHPGPLLWTRLLDFAYSLWFPLLPVTVVYFLLHVNRAKSKLFLSSFLALWPVGLSLGLLFPSHGPCYVDPASFPARGMLYCSEVQTYLYGRFLQTTAQSFSLQGNLSFGCGLMALPSHHVAFAFLYVLFFWSEGPWLRHFTVSFLILIFVGSVYSGWHYAVDGYAGILITLLVVLLFRRLFRREGGAYDRTN